MNTDDGMALLSFESRPWSQQGPKEQAIRTELGLSPAVYYQRLNRLIDTEAALAAFPLLVNRLRGIRQAARQRRARATVMTR